MPPGGLLRSPQELGLCPTHWAGLGALLPGAVGSRYRIFFSYSLLPSRRITEALLLELKCVCPRTLQSAPPERATDHVLTASVASRLMPQCTNNKGNSTTAPLAAIPCACAHGMPEPSNSQGVYAPSQARARALPLRAVTAIASTFFIGYILGGPAVLSP